MNEEFPLFLLRRRTSGIKQSDTRGCIFSELLCSKLREVTEIRACSLLRETLPSQKILLPPKSRRKLESKLRLSKMKRVQTMTRGKQLLNRDQIANDNGLCLHGSIK